MKRRKTDHESTIIVAPELCPVEVDDSTGEIAIDPELIAQTRTGLTEEDEALVRKLRDDLDEITAKIKIPISGERAVEVLPGQVTKETEMVPQPMRFGGFLKRLRDRLKRQ